MLAHEDVATKQRIGQRHERDFVDADYPGVDKIQTRRVNSSDKESKLMHYPTQSKGCARLSDDKWREYRNAVKQQHAGAKQAGASQSRRCCICA
ncbi:hypothetical protein ABBQ38_001349 [Trebouxia sp. C0009 RCD-2024]